MTLLSEAHQPLAGRSLALVRRLRPRKKRGIALMLFWGLILINELRGLAVAKEIWPLFFG